MATVWITGASGFIGSNLVARAPADWDIWKITRGYSSAKQTLMFNPLYPAGGLDGLPKPDIVIHLGANANPRATNGIMSNIEYTSTITDYLSRQKTVCNMVFASTINVYGGVNPTEIIDESTLPVPTTQYATSKVMCESLLAYHRLSNPNINSAILRFPGVVGPYMTHGIVKDIVDRLYDKSDKAQRLDGRSLTIMGNDPGTFKTYIHVDDAIDAILWAADGRHSTPYHNVVYGQKDYGITAKEAAEIIINLIGYPVELKWTGTTFPGDFSAPRVFNSSTYFYHKRRYETAKEAFTKGVQDYLCKL